MNKPPRTVEELVETIKAWYLKDGSLSLTVIGVCRGQCQLGCVEPGQSAEFRRAACEEIGRNFARDFAPWPPELVLVAMETRRPKAPRPQVCITVWEFPDDAKAPTEHLLMYDVLQTGDQVDLHFTRRVEPGDYHDYNLMATIRGVYKYAEANGLTKHRFQKN